MNDIPPKHTPDDAAASGGNLISLYQTGPGTGSESFPVLKAFQDYIEAERAQARKRVFTLSIVFAVIICAVVGGFLSVGIYLLRDMSSLQGKLVDAALAPRIPVAEVPPPPPPRHLRRRQAWPRRPSGKSPRSPPPCRTTSASGLTGSPRSARRYTRRSPLRRPNWRSSVRNSGRCGNRTTSSRATSRPCASPRPPPLRGGRRNPPRPTGR